MLGVGDYLWRLVPANPILLRVVEGAGRRHRDLFVRAGYLGLLVLLVLVSLAGSGLGGGSLTALAQTSAKLFQNMSYLQLTLVALLAPIFTAGAITQEKDSQTYDILLSTPMTNGQIVLGSLLSRVFFVVALLVSGIPIFSITQIFGGVAIRSIVLSFAIAAATALITGAIAMAIATFKVGTRRTIFSFYLFIVIFVVGGILLDRPTFMHPIIGFETDSNSQIVKDAAGNPKPIYATTSWLTGINPFLALRVLFHQKEYTPPDFTKLPENLKGWPTGWYLSSPETFYIWLTATLSLVMVLPSIVLLRRLAQSTTTLRGTVLQALHISSGDRRRKPRTVWFNPIAWREAKTKASAARASILRYGFIIGGVAAAIAFLVLFSQETLEGQYITTNSFNPVQNTLTVFQGDNALHYRLLPNAKITLNGHEATTENLSDRLKINALSVSRPGRMEITDLQLVDVPRRMTSEQTRGFLLGSMIVEFAVILLIVTNAAASTVTREKEDGTLDILLATPITSRYYIWGKLRGLVSYVLPLVAVPIASALLFIIYDSFRFWAAGGANLRWIVFPEAVLIMPGMLIMVTAFASILGMQLSLRCRTTVRAVMSSIGIMVGICGVFGMCGYSALQGRAGEPMLAISSFSPFTLLTILVDPENYGGSVFQSGGDAVEGRIIVFIFALIATGAYALIVWTMYKSMVKNFDMTIRKQSR